MKKAFNPFALGKKGEYDGIWMIHTDTHKPYWLDLSMASGTRSKESRIALAVKYE